MDSSIVNILEWLKTSGIQNSGGVHKGGFNGWYDAASGSYPFVYSEITGYGITTLLYANRIHADKFYLDKAGEAAWWISEKAMHSCGGIRARAYNSNPDNHYSFENNVLYTFDSGMVLAGLINLFSATKNTKHLDTSISVGNFLVDMQKHDGTFYAAYDANNDERIDNQEKWSTQSGSFHAKLAIGLLELYRHTHEDVYSEAAMKICDAALRFQDNNGNFITQASEKSTHTHPHCYSAEGLAYAGIFNSDDRLTDAAVNAIKWILDNQQPDGGVPPKFVNGQFISFQRSDTLAQVLRLGAFFRNTNRMDGYDEKLKKLASRLLEFQNNSGVHKGGFFYGSELDGTKRNHVNSWCSMFALNALDVYNNKRDNLDLLI